jgi:hypothetical protein
MAEEQNDLLGIGRFPRWKQIAFFFLAVMTLLAVFSWIAQAYESHFGSPQAPKNDFTLTAAPGTNMDGAIDEFKTLVAHCPGIYKYKEDVEKVEYLNGGHADFMITVKQKPTVIPPMSYAQGHTCHFSVNDAMATVSKRPCSWLCTGDDMSGIDGDDHSYSKGKLIGTR